MNAESQAEDGAAAGPERTPRAALAALRPQARKVGAVSIGPFTLEHWLALQELENPVVIGGTPTKRDVVKAAGLMTIPAELLAGEKSLLAEQAENSGRTVASQLFPGDMTALIEAVNACIVEAFAAHIPAQPADGRGREKKVPAAGSSTSSRPSGG
ncbi:MAG TPA: hypothetical protein PLU30_24600 [Verrucomicrobiae bacterium]|nr:hypothetical protein [Verrucomicrobiae bacterium]